MPDYSGILKTIKKAGVDAANAGKPVNVCFGKVTSTKPLEILVEQKMPLDDDLLILTKNVVDNVLKIGDTVVLLRIQGGQKYIVIDKVV